jgi:hypothetical protein
MTAPQAPGGASTSTHNAPLPVTNPNHWIAVGLLAGLLLILAAAAWHTALQNPHRRERLYRLLTILSTAGVSRMVGTHRAGRKERP